MGWACSLYAGIISHWEKRNGREIWKLDPNTVDKDMMLELIDQHGTSRYSRDAMISAG